MEDLSGYKWTGYPVRNGEEMSAYNFEVDGFKVSDQDKHHTDRVKSEFVGKLIEHRVENWSNYNWLLHLKEQGKGNEDAIEALLAEHRNKERHCNNLTPNRAFKGMAYTHETQSTFSNKPKEETGQDIQPVHQA